MKILSFLVYILIIMRPQAQAQSFELLPREKLFQKYYADALSHQFSLYKDLGSNQWYGNAGAEIPVFNIIYRKNIFQATAAATVFNTVIKTPGHIQVYTVDYLVDFFFDYNLHTEIPVRFIFGHLSAHFSDDGITELNNYPISYVRDYAGIHSQFNFGESKVYLGYTYNFHIEPESDKKSTIQFGGDKFISIAKYVKIYGAVDFKIKSEVNNVPTQSYQTGLYVNMDSRALRVAYNYRKGYDERGQFYNIKTEKHILGIILDI